MSLHAIALHIDAVLHNPINSNGVLFGHKQGFLITIHIINTTAENSINISNNFLIL